jgi:hypothetical protein
MKIGKIGNYRQLKAACCQEYSVSFVLSVFKKNLAASRSKKDYGFKREYLEIRKE